MATLSEIRSKYPEYDDLSDEDLAEALRIKSYSDMPRDEFYQRIGMSTGEPYHGHPAPARGTSPEDAAVQRFQNFTKDISEYTPPAGDRVEVPKTGLMREELRSPDGSAPDPGSRALDPRARLIQRFLGMVTGSDKPDPRVYRGPEEVVPPIPGTPEIPSHSAPPRQPGVPAQAPAPMMAPPVAPASVPVPDRSSPIPPQTIAQMIAQAASGGQAQHGPAGNLVIPGRESPDLSQPDVIPDPFAGESARDLLTRRGQEVAQGAGGIFASSLDGLAVAEKRALEASHSRAAAPRMAEEKIATIRDIEQRLKEPGLDQNTRAFLENNLADLTQGVQRLDDIASGDLPDASESEFATMATDLRQKVIDWAGAPPEDPSFWSKFAQGGGSMMGFLALTAAGGLAGGGPGSLVATAKGGSLANAGDVYREAKDSGASEQDAIQAAGWASLGGYSEALPLGRAFRFLPSGIRDKVGATFAGKLGEIALNAGEEGAQEWGQTVYNNLIAKGYYDPDRGWSEDANESGLIGLMLGTGTGTLAAATSRRDKKSKPGDIQTELAAPPSPQGLAGPRMDTTAPHSAEGSRAGQALLELTPEMQVDPGGAIPNDAHTPPGRPGPSPVVTPEPAPSEQNPPSPSAADAQPVPRSQPASPDASAVPTTPTPEAGVASVAGTVELASAGQINPTEWTEIPVMAGDKETGRTVMENQRTGEILSRPAFDQRVADQQAATDQAADAATTVKPKGVTSTQANPLKSGEAEQKDVTSQEAPVVVTPPEPRREITKGPASTVQSEGDVSREAPTFADFRSALPQDREGMPDYAGAGAAALREVGADVWGNADAQQKAAALEYLRGLTKGTKPKSADQVAGGETRAPAAVKSPGPAPGTSKKITLAQAGSRWDGMTPKQRIEFIQQANPRSSNKRARERLASRGWADMPDNMRAKVAEAIDRVDAQDAAEVSPTTPAAGESMEDRARAAAGDGYKVVQIKELDNGRFEAIVERTEDRKREKGTGDTPEAAVQEAIGKLYWRQGEPGAAAPQSAEGTTGPRVFVNRVGPDGKTDAERGGPYESPEGTVAWADAKPGDTLANGTILVRKGIRTKKEAQHLADKFGSTVVQDGARKWGVIKEKAPAQAPGPVVSGGTPSPAPDTETATPAADRQPTYINRPVTNAEDLIAWAKAEGFTSTLPADDMHVTIAFSKEPVDRNDVAFAARSGTLQSIGGARSIEKFGDAVVLRFEESALQSRWQETQDAGASWDFDGYKPHVTITYKAGDVDLDKVTPYAGPIRFGPESVEAINEDFADDLEEVPTGAAKKEEAQREAGPVGVEARVPEQGTLSSEDDTATPAPQGQPGTVALAREIANRIRSGKGLPQTSMGLTKLASKYFGGTVAEGAFSPKDAYDALELGMNMSVSGNDAAAPIHALPQAKDAVGRLQDQTDKLPTQTRRDTETDAFQQFSTPPAYAYAVNWIANIKPGDQVLEPSAGNGGIAVFAQNAGATVDVNELAERRVPSLEALGFNRVTSEDAEQIANIWAGDDSRRYDVVVMNPPFSAAGARGTKNTSATGARHIEQALELLKPGGRLVAIMGHAFQPGNSRVAPFFKSLTDNHTLQANVVVQGEKVYKKYGTAYDNRVLVIDKVPPPEGHTTLTGDAATIPELMDMMEGVRNVANDRRPTAERSQGDVEEQAGNARREPARPGREPAGRERKLGAEPDDLAGTTDRAGRHGRPDTADGSAGRAAVNSREGAGKSRPGKPDAGSRAGRSGRAVTPTDGRNALELKDAKEHGVEDAGGGFAKYQPSRVRIEGAHEHPMLLVESTAMASVQPPRPTYEVHVPRKMVTDGLLSEAQLEQVVYAGSAHSQMLPAMRADTAPRRKGYYIGDGCVSGDTLIYDPITETHTPIRTLTERGKDINVLALTEHGLRAVRAQMPFQKGVAPLYCVTTEGGRKITVTQGHQFLTPSGWQTLRSGVRVGHLLASAPSLPVSSSGTARSTRGASDRHSTQTHEGYLDHYYACHRSCGEQPHSAQDIGQGAVPSPTGVLACILDCQRSGGHSPSPEHIHRSQCSDRLSRSDCAPSATRDREQISTRVSASDALSTAQSTSSPRLSPGWSDAHQAALERDPYLLEETAFGSPLHADHSSVPSAEYGGWDRIVSIDFMGLEPFYDMVVPVHANYVAEGLVNHNTGVGKTREIAGIIADNWSQGRKKHILISKDKKLLKSARRDFDNVGMKAVPIADLGATKADGSIPKDREGVVFATYSTIGKSAPAGKQSRIDQIVAWLGSDFDGTITFDEAHLAGNALPIKGKRGTSKPSQAALAVVELQERLPNARVIYASATAATEVHNLAYADRLGLWGPGTPFPNALSFATQIDKGGIAAMEVVARDMKQMGVYMARGLSYEGVEYAKVEHELTADQSAMYDAAALGWQTILQNITEIIDNHTNGGGRQRATALGQFWSAHQRFFNQVLTSMQMPTIMKSIDADIAAGLAPVIQVVNTNEAATKKAIAKMEDGDTLEDIDITPRDGLIQFLETSFPVHQFEEYTDDNGNIRTRPVTDSKGNFLLNAKAVAAREALIDQLSAMTLPGNPLDMIIDKFGADNVAEVTGRSNRIVTKDGKKKTERRSQSKALAEATEFQAGKRKILVFSDAGGTGMDFHADKGAKNQARRAHYILQAGWRADRAIQGFGRTHRTNQVEPPIYKLAGTNLSGHKRFTSSIARRLDQLGALTKGQKDAGTGMFDATDNLENVFADAALTALFSDIYAGEIDGFTAAEVEQELGLKVVSEKGFDVSRVPPVPQFLNRLLNVSIDKQNLLFDQFMKHMNAAVEIAIQNGEYTAGVEEVKHDGAVVADTKEAYRDPETGAHSEYRRVTLTKKVVPIKFSELNGAYKNITWKKHADTGLVYGFRPASSRTTDDGQVVPTYHRYSVTDRSIIDSTDYRFKYEIVKADEAEKAWDQQYEDAPKTREETLHMVTGALLPIWDRLPQSSPRIVRLKTDDGRSLLGREIPEIELVRALDNLGVDRPQIDMTAEDIQAAVMEGRTVLVSSGHRLERRKVGGEQRIEVIPPASSAWQDTSSGGTLSRLGFSIERINYKARAFAPVGERGVKPITDFMLGKDVVNVTTTADQRAAPMFYSPILRGIEAAKQKRAPAQDWKAIIAKMPGVKRAEIDWLGVEDWLDMQKGQVARENLADFVRDSQISIREDVLSEDFATPDYNIEIGDLVDPDPEFIRANAEDRIDEAITEIAEQEDIDEAEVDREEAMERAIEMETDDYFRFGGGDYDATLYNRDDPTISYEGYWNSYDDDFWFKGLGIDDGNVDRVTALEMAEAAHEERLRDGGAQAVGPTQHGYHTEEGGTNYREILLRMPMLHQQGKNDKWEIGEDGVGRDMGRAEPFVQPGHFDQTNIVVHARVKDRKGPNGEKVLFVEEIQSDLASLWREGSEPEAVTARRRELAERNQDLSARQATAFQRIDDRKIEIGNRPGFAATVPTHRFAIREVFGDLQPSEPDLYERPSSKRFLDELRNDAIAKEAWSEYKSATAERAIVSDDLLRLGTEKRMDPRTPDTPFKEAATYQLMVKRLMQMAADGGYDTLAWTPGYMQAERWNRAAQNVVDSLDWTHRTDSQGEQVVDVQLHMADRGGTIDLIADRETGNIEYAGRDIFDGKNLRDAVGPGVAAQILREESGNLPGAKITFPDSGYAIAYDQQTRKAVDKFARKYGSRVVEDRTLPDFNENPVTQRTSMFKPDDSNPVWSVAITPELRAAATESQPILRKGEANAPFQSRARGSKMYQSLKKELAKVGLGDVDIQFNPALQHQGLASTDFFGRMVLTIGRTIETDMTVGHEMIHFLRHMNLFTKEEWTVLQEAANAEWMERYHINERYPDLTIGQKFEEAIAEAFGEVYASKKAPFKMSNKVRAALRKVSNFIKAMRSWAKGRGFKTADDVFQAIMQGEFAGRRRPDGWVSQTARLRKQQRRPSPQQRTRGNMHIPDRYVWDSLMHTNGSIFQRLSEAKGAIGDRFDSARTSIQDRMLPILRAQQIVERELGRNVPEGHDAYLAEEMYSGRAGAKLDQIDRDFTTKIIRIIGNTQGMTVETVGRYLYARHAAERNARIAEINEKFPDGGSGMSNDEARAILKGIDSSPQAAAYQDIADIIDGMREWALDLRVKSGLMTKDQAGAWRSTYQKYVPLKGWAESDGADAELDMSGTGRGYNVRGPESMRALGRQSEAFNPLIAAITQAQETVIRAEKNRVGQHLYRLARDIPAPGLWEVKQAETRRVFNEHTGLVEERSMSPITLMQSTNEMAVKVGGQEQRVIFNDQRLANSAMNIGIDGLHAWLGWLSKFSRYFSAINTMLNPVFVVKNFVRDTVTANINIGSKEMSGKIRRGMMKDLPKAMAGSYRGLGKGKATTEWSRYFREYSDVGGKVSFWVMENPESSSTMIEKRVRREAGGAVGLALGIMTPNADLNPVLHAVERVNLAVDNAIRLSAYVHARKNGYSQQKAASLAKNLTVNFNRRGKYGSLINAAWTFSNAGFQGTQVVFQAMRHRKVQATVAGMVVLAYLLDQANAYLSDEDDDGQLVYDKLADYLHEMHLVVMLGQKDKARDAVSVWLPYGYNVFPLFGNLVSRVQRGVISPEEAISTMAHASVNAFMPISDSDLASTLSPTLVDPFFEISRNKNWLGWGIHPDPAFSDTGRYGDDSRPKSERYFSGASTAARLAAVKANQWSGGNYVESGWVDVYPDDIDHLTAYFMGGMGRTFGQSVDLFTKMTNGEEVNVRDVPLAKDVYRQVSDRDDRRLYFDRREEIAQAYERATYLSENNDPIPPHILWRARLYGQMKEAEKLRRGNKTTTADPERAILGLNQAYVSAWKANTRYSSESIFDKIPGR